MVSRVEKGVDKVKKGAPFCYMRRKVSADAQDRLRMSQKTVSHFEMSTANKTQLTWLEYVSCNILTVAKNFNMPIKFLCNKLEDLANWLDIKGETYTRSLFLLFLPKLPVAYFIISLVLMMMSPIGRVGFWHEIYQGIANFLPLEHRSQSPFAEKQTASDEQMEKERTITDYIRFCYDDLRVSMKKIARKMIQSMEYLRSFLGVESKEYGMILLVMCIPKPPFIYTLNVLVMLFVYPLWGVVVSRAIRQEALRCLTYYRNKGCITVQNAVKSIAKTAPKAANSIIQCGGACCRKLTCVQRRVCARSVELSSS